jgi:hydroxymethylpyrimidine/phosphomethylpyrimidine kinase
VVAVALTIAGSDSGGGAGVQADLKTFAAFGVHGTSVITALTAQNTRGVQDVGYVAPEFIGAQLDAVLDDFDLAAVKTGMLGGVAAVEVVVERLGRRSPRQLVVDPVMKASAGGTLLEPAAAALLRARLLPLATLVTPNLHEAETLTGRPVRDVAGMRDAARALVDLGARAALVTGGHLPGAPVDVLFDGHALHELAGTRVAGESPHGTGCALSAAVTARLALGDELLAAVDTAKHWVARAIAATTPLGHGVPPLRIPPPD